MQYYLEPQATFDPGYRIAAHELSILHLKVWGGAAPGPDARPGGHFWKPALYDFHRFTGDARHADLAPRIAVSSSPGYTNPWNASTCRSSRRARRSWSCARGDPYHRGASAGNGFRRHPGSTGGAGIPARIQRAKYPSGTPLELFTGWYIHSFLGLHPWRRPA